MITKSELIEYLKHTPENTNYNILYSSLYNGSNKEVVNEFIEVLSRGNLSLAALQPYLAKLYEDDKTISPEPLPPSVWAQMQSDVSDLNTRVTELEEHGGGGGVQPDWNQNDSTAADYVKNRPFYTGDPGETVLVEESTISFTDAGGIYAAEFPTAFVATVGETYTVYWDSTAYECICADFNGMPVLGNLSIYDAGSDTGEPFAIFNEAGLNETGWVSVTADTSASHTISISKVVTEVVKIDTKYLPFLPKPSSESYLTFSSPNSFTLYMLGGTKTWDGTLEYFASDETWTVWDGTSVLSAVTNGGEYVIHLRGAGNTIIAGGPTWQLQGSDIACIGNIETLLDYATVESGEHPVMGDHCYAGMFYGCKSLIKAPELPATTLANYCYNSMFYGCTNLIQPPKLPATTLANGCYSIMFYGCTSLILAPELPATTLAEECYYSMFYGCTNLIKAPKLPAITLVERCYEAMFAYCTSLAQVPELPATTLVDYCYAYMFEGCTSIKLSSTKTEEYTQEYRIPSSGEGINATHATTSIFINSDGGTFTQVFGINTTYYLSSDNMIVRGSELANLNGYVQTMIDNAECIIPSSTSGSTKKFKITVDDSGTISATEVT